jgi:hypothetical protein
MTKPNEENKTARTLDEIAAYLGAVAANPAASRAVAGQSAVTFHGILLGLRRLLEPHVEAARPERSKLEIGNVTVGKSGSFDNDGFAEATLTLTIAGARRTMSLRLTPAAAKKDAPQELLITSITEPVNDRAPRKISQVVDYVGIAAAITNLLGVE